MKFKSYLIYICLIIASCTSKPNKFSDPILIKIAEFKDKRQTDSLIHFLLNRNPLYRTEAAIALASVQDTLASLQLGTMLLEDPIVEARKAAAFALGQTKGTAAVNALIPSLEDKDNAVISEVLESLGKAIMNEDLPILKRYKAKDTITQHGLAWGFYYLGLRGMADSTIVKKAKEFLSPKYSTQTRIGAAHFFSRATKLPILLEAEELIYASSKDPSAYVRMAATSGLRKLDSSKSIPPLVKIASDDPDYRVRISAIRSLSSWTDPRSMESIIQSLDDENENVGIAASEVWKPMGSYKERVITKARTSKNWRIQGNLFRRLLSIGINDDWVEEVKSLYAASKNEYQKSSLLLALSSDVRQYPFIARELIESTSYVIQSNAAMALVEVTENTSMNGEIRQEIVKVYKDAILRGDPGVVGIIASTLIDPSKEYKKVITDYSFLMETKKKLTLPKDIEALQPLEEAIAYFEGKAKPPQPKNQFNHPIQWELAKSIKRDQEVKIETTKGTITLKLLVEEAPGSVANFVALVNQNYFNQKYFHRVVPNFVIQTGCNRGDGFGSEDYSIRSEFSMRRYAEGSVGMASAGKDTEGTQWFITHSPTPHLNGRYTIFAEVINGLEIVHAIEVGDKIVKVSTR